MILLIADGTLWNILYYYKHKKKDTKDLIKEIAKANKKLRYFVLIEESPLGWWLATKIGDHSDAFTIYLLDKEIKRIDIPSVLLEKVNKRVLSKEDLHEIESALNRYVYGEKYEEGSN